VEPPRSDSAREVRDGFGSHSAVRNHYDGIILCQLWGNPLIPGSSLDYCAECGSKVSIAPSGRSEKMRGMMMVVCVQCGLALMREHGITPEAPSSEQKREIIKCIEKLASEKGP
jgi:hypothetical protein